MNATTTTRKAKNSEGQVFSLPASWPTALDFADMRGGLPVFADLLKVCNNILTAGKSLSSKDRCNIWESLEETFLSVNGATWQEMLSELREMIAETLTAEKTYPKCQDPISADEIAKLERIYNQGPFQVVNIALYKSLFLGACTYRREGLSYHLWAARVLCGDTVLANGTTRGLVALIAYRVWSMSNADVCTVEA